MSYTRNSRSRRPMACVFQVRCSLASAGRHLHAAAAPSASGN